MNQIIFTFCLILLFTSLQFSAADECAKCAEDTLKEKYGEIIYAGLLFRHGNRVPEKLYPTDPHTNYSWPFEPGQLVIEGKQRAFRLGKFFRPRYVHLVGDTFSPSKAITHASGYDRTLMSGLLFNAGFFPPSSKEMWNPQLQWQPVPIQTSPGDIDNILRLNKVTCPRLNELKKKFYEKGEAVKKLCNKYKDEVAHVDKHSGFKSSPCTSEEGYLNMLFVQDTLLVETEQNLTLPEWSKKVFPEPLNTFRASFYMEVEDPEIKKFYAGPFFSVVASDLLDVAGWKNYTIPKTMYTAEPTKAPRLHLFSAHDTNIIILLRTLGVYKNKSPNYSAAVGFELRKKASQYYVTVIYENSLDEKLQVLEIPACKGVCTLQQFLSFITPIMQKNYEAECSLNNSGHKNSGKSGKSHKRHVAHPRRVGQ